MGPKAEARIRTASDSDRRPAGSPGNRLGLPTVRTVRSTVSFGPAGCRTMDSGVRQIARSI